MWLKTVQKEIDSKYRDIELVKGEGYFYLVYDLNNTFDGRDIYETKSIVVDKINDLPLESWMFEVEVFWEEIKKKYS